MCVCVTGLQDVKAHCITPFPLPLFSLMAHIRYIVHGKRKRVRRKGANSQQSITSLTSSGQSGFCFIVMSLLTLEQMMVDRSLGLKPGRHFSLIKQGENGSSTSVSTNLIICHRLKLNYRLYILTSTLKRP